MRRLGAFLVLFSAVLLAGCEVSSDSTNAKEASAKEAKEGRPSAGGS